MQLKTREEGETFWEQIEGPANDEQWTPWCVESLLELILREEKITHNLFIHNDFIGELNEVLVHL
jgi:hypothetical protein